MQHWRSHLSPCLQSSNAEVIVCWSMLGSLVTSTAKSNESKYLLHTKCTIFAFSLFIGQFPLLLQAFTGSKSVLPPNSYRDKILGAKCSRACLDASKSIMIDPGLSIKVIYCPNILSPQHGIVWLWLKWALFSGSKKLSLKLYVQDLHPQMEFEFPPMPLENFD